MDELKPVREKLIELIGMAQDCGCDLTDVIKMNYVENDALADCLIANGVTIPVRCKDCVHMRKKFNARYCKVWRAFNGMGDEGFCNYGERKDGDQS